MGDLILLSERRRAVKPDFDDVSPDFGDPGGGLRYGVRGRYGVSGATAPTAFFFDLGCPFSYLAAERVERLLGAVIWIPTPSPEFHGGDPWSDARACARLRIRAEQRAEQLRLPLVWPERFPASAPMALRAAAYSSELGAGPAFALAAARLAFCGGFDLEDPEVLAEAAAAAGMALEDCLAAAGDPSRDEQLLVNARGLTQRGIKELPAVRVGGRHIAGECHLSEAAALHAATRDRTLAPGA